MDFLAVKFETKKEFQKIAQTLFDDYAIESYKTKYRLSEIEFYWNSPTHVDNSVYERKYVDLKAGDWFFHYSGVDIALKNDETSGYGGILIRSIYDIEAKKKIKGPMVCAMILFSETSAFADSIKTRIIPYKFPNSEIVRKTRIGLGKNALHNNANSFEYSFSIDPENIPVKQ